MSLPIALQRKDSIVIPTNKVQDLFEWRNANKDLVHKFTPYLEDVVIKVGGLSIHVEKSPDLTMSYRFTVYNTEEKLLVQDWNRHTMIGNISYNKVPKDIIENDEMAKDYAQSVISSYCTLMAYMGRDKEIVTKKEITQKKVKDRKKKGGKGKKVTYIRNTVYTVTGDFKMEPETKRTYTPSKEPFKVTGHWRHYKSGKIVWVDGYTKGKGTPEPKVYQV